MKDDRDCVRILIVQIACVMCSSTEYTGKMRVVLDLTNNFEGSINLIPLNKEKYILFTKYIDGLNVKPRFIDSLRFMNSSLDNLAKRMKDVKVVKKGFSHLEPEKLELLCRKGVYPYEYMDCREKLLERQLYVKEQFHSALKGAHISDENYLHAAKVWETFGCQTLEDYTLLYNHFPQKICSENQISVYIRRQILFSGIKHHILQSFKHDEHFIEAKEQLNQAIFHVKSHAIPN